ncbi:MAG: hypothetical protein AAF550_06265 [Myxococcota bacterium]
MSRQTKGPEHVATQPAHEPVHEMTSLTALFFRYSRRRTSLFIAALLCSTALLVFRSGGQARGRTVDQALFSILSRRGLQLVPDSTLWLDPLDRTRFVSALFLAKLPEQHTDVYFARLRANRNSVVDLFSLHNLTRTPLAEELQLVRSGVRVACLSRVRGEYEAVVVFDLRGEEPHITAGWSQRQRVQNAITNLQTSGRSQGFGKVRYVFAAPRAQARLEASSDEFLLRMDEGAAEVRVDLLALETSAADFGLEGPDLVVQHQYKGAPGGISWVVDTVRSLPFVGPEPVDWLERRVFGLRDLIQRAKHRVLGGTRRELSAEVAEELGVSEEETRRRLSATINDPELKWPPPDLSPLMAPSLDHEGVWVPVVDDPFVSTYPNAPPAFYQTFLRPDLERVFSKVFIVLWDPRQVQLRVMTGTQEPESVTGSLGAGMIPRDSKLLQRVVGGFNGGFQAVHGEFGVMSDGEVYLPPKPWSATVGLLRDGRPTMGSWLPAPAGVREYRESWATAQIPSNLIEYRQNLTSLVEDGTYNPWSRWYWGAASPNAEEQTFIYRTGICLTEEHYLAYFWGPSLGPKSLGEAMLSVRCIRGMHLDMNHVHTGFEFFNIVPRSQPFPALGRALDTANEFEGDVPGMPALHMRARRAVKPMIHMNFPRYVARDPRDFFYLTQLPTLPGPPVGTGEVFSTKGLPHVGWPHAFARVVMPELTLVRIDPRRAMPEPMAWPGLEKPIAYLTEVPMRSHQEGWEALWYQERTTGYSMGVGQVPRGGKALLYGPVLTEDSVANAALGVDQDGFLLYAETSSEDRSLCSRMRSAGVERALILSGEARLAFVVGSETMDLQGFERSINPTEALKFFGNDRPAAEVLFPEVQPRPYGVWAHLQDARVRYLKLEGPSRFLGPQ